MSESRRRAILYAAGVLLAAGLLFAGFGLPVPADPGTRLSGAALLANTGNYDAALEICDEVLARQPDNLDAHVFRATFLGAAGRYEESIAEYDEALARVGEDHELRDDLRQDRAAVLLQAGHEQDFERERTALAREGRTLRVLVLDGFAAARRKDWETAARAYGRAHELSPADQQLKSRLWNALVARGDALVADRRFEEARDAFDAARPLFPDASVAQLKAAEVRLAMDDASGALDVLRRLRPATPGIAPLVFRGATALLAEGRQEEALEALAGAAQADPEATRTLFEKESSWAPYRSDKAVRALFEGQKEQKNRSGLTDPK